MSLQVQKLANLIHSVCVHGSGTVPHPLTLLPLLKSALDGPQPNPLVILARSILHLKQQTRGLKLFKRNSTTDINNYDFNWNDKLHSKQHLRTIDKSLSLFIKRTGLEGISLGGDRFKQVRGSNRVIMARDRRVVLWVLGYCEVNNCLEWGKLSDLL